MNRIIIQQKGLGEVKAIPADMAFNKGVDYFTEIVFFYLVVFAIAFYELDKSNKSRKRTMDRFKAVKTNTTQFSQKMDEAKSDMNRITTLQQDNRKEIEDLEA